MNSTLWSVALYIFSVFVASCSQIMLKYAAKNQKFQGIREYLNVPVIAAYGLLFCSMGMTMVALRHLPLSSGTVLESMGYIFVYLLSFFLLRERISKRRIIGMVIILFGIVVYGI